MPGKMPGDQCPGCKEGRLVVRTANHSNEPSDPMQIVIGGRYNRWTTVAHLVCSACSGMYEAADRGKDAKKLLEAQLKGFTNPAEEPVACAKCGEKLVESDDSDDTDGGFALTVTRYRACDGCLTVAWVAKPRELSNDGFERLHGFELPSPPPDDAPRRRRRR